MNYPYILILLTTALFIGNTSFPTGVFIEFVRPTNCNSEEGTTCDWLVIQRYINEYVKNTVVMVDAINFVNLTASFNLLENATLVSLVSCFQPGGMPLDVFKNYLLTVIQNYPMIKGFVFESYNPLYAIEYYRYVVETLQLPYVYFVMGMMMPKKETRQLNSLLPFDPASVPKAFFIMKTTCSEFVSTYENAIDFTDWKRTVLLFMDDSPGDLQHIAPIIKEAQIPMIYLENNGPSTLSSFFVQTFAFVQSSFTCDSSCATCNGPTYADCKTCK